MTVKVSTAPRRRMRSAWIAGVLTALVATLTVAMMPGRGYAIATFVDLGAAESFAVLGGQSVTNTGPSVITGDVGVSPGTSITGFPPGLVTGGAIHQTDALAAQAQTDLTTGYNNAASQAPDASITADLGGQTLVPGVYRAASTAGITGTLTLNAQGNADSVWVFQIGSALTTAPSSSVLLVNGASPCNVFWQIGSSATLDTNTTFVGTIMALQSITVNTGASIDGRALARNGSVTLDTNRITRPLCDTPPTTGGTIAGPITGGTIAGPTTGGVITGGTIAGPTTGGTIAGPTTGGTIAGPPPGGVIGGPTTGGTTGGVVGGDTGGPGGGHGGSNGGYGGDDYSDKPEKP
jgi:hypothetical protein